MWFTLLPIAFAIGASLGAQGNFLGPIIALLIWIPISWAVKFYSLIYGYKYGDRLALVLKGDVLKFFRDAIAAFAVAMMGGIGASYVTPPPFVQVTLSIYGVSIQNIMDMIIPRLLPLLIVLYAYWIVKRGVPLSLAVLSLFLTGLGLSLLNVLGPPGTAFQWPTLLNAFVGVLLLIVAVIIDIFAARKK